MTPEQELTAMIEAELERFAMQWCYRQSSGVDKLHTQVVWEQTDDLREIQEMLEPDRQNAALRKLYWLATDPDDMVH